jgi:aminoglycoside phosphotransferase (APT) family kinase protein
MLSGPRLSSAPTEGVATILSILSPELIQSPSPLEPRALLALLCDAGLVSRNQIVGGSVQLRPASQRNYSFRVEVDSGPSYFLKQGVSAPTIATVRREAALYDFVASTFTEFARYTPKRVCFLPEHCLLVVDVVRTGVPLNELRVPRSASRIFSRVGNALALLHNQSDFPGSETLRRPAPFVANIASLPSSVMTNISAAGVELIRTIQQFPDYETLLGEALGDTIDSCLVHNDFKSANCLLGQRNSPILIDWEFASLGNPAWDVGCVFADFLSAWLLSMPLGSRIGVNRVAQVAARPLSAARPTIRSFWEAYSSRRGLGGEAALSFLARAAKCTGLRLSQSAYEMCQETMNLSATELYFMQTSWNILKRPVEALVRLLGLDLASADPVENRLGMHEELHTPR